MRQSGSMGTSACRLSDEIGPRVFAQDGPVVPAQTGPLPSLSELRNLAESTMRSAARPQNVSLVEACREIVVTLHKQRLEIAAV
jgi:hypothetical protein